MKVLLVRHAEAADVGRDGVRSDGERPLTAKGHATADRLAMALQTRGYKFDALLCSPLLRARQTAEPLKQLLADPTLQFALCQGLASGRHDSAAVCAAIAATGGREVAVVGHLPDIAELAGYLLGIVGGAVAFDKGTAAYFDCGGALVAGQATLEWALAPEWY